MGEQRDRRPLRVLRGIAVALMGLVVVFTLLGGIGTTCVAFGAENYDSMASLVPYKPLYQALVVISVAIGIWGIPVTVSLVRGSRVAYRNTLLNLVAGALSAGVQMVVSQTVRGSSAPVNMRFYVTAFTLGFFLLLRLPGVRERVDFTQAAKGKTSGPASVGAAFVVCGLVTLTAPVWAGFSHMSSARENWVEVLGAPLRAGGWAMVGVGMVWLLAAVVSSMQSEKAALLEAHA
mgnify:CR=1 FL=1